MHGCVLPHIARLFSSPKHQFQSHSSGCCYPTRCSECPKRHVPRPHSCHGADRVRSLLHSTLPSCIAIAYTSHDIIPHIQENILLKPAKSPTSIQRLYGVGPAGVPGVTFFNLLSLSVFLCPRAGLDPAHGQYSVDRWPPLCVPFAIHYSPL